MNSNNLTFLWVSPDPYNSVAFFSEPNGKGAELGTFSGSDLACFSGGTCKDGGFDLVTFSAIDGDIGSIVLNNNTGAAFEFTFDPVATPLPSAICFFGSLLGGVFWLGRRKHSLGRRKHSGVSSLGAA